MLVLRLGIVLVVISLTACGGGGSGGGSASSLSTPVPRGDRLLSIDISLPEDNDYVAAFEHALLTDMDIVKLSYDWDQLDADMSITDPIGAFYPAYSMPVAVFIRPIHINADERPVGLQGLDFDHPDVSTAFNSLVDSFMANVAPAEVSAIIVGSEINPYLDTDAKWVDYIAFFTVVTNHIHTNHPGVMVGSEVMFELYQRGTTSERARWNELCTVADFIGISYYGHSGDPEYLAAPPSAVAGDFATMVTQSVDKPIWLPQIGYPSATICGSSEAQQAAWLQAAFQAWDTHRADIKMLSFTWMHEWDTAAINAWMNDVLGISDPSTTKLDEFLGSLGYRTYAGSGSDKLAWPAITNAAAARGWQRSPPFFKPLPQ